MKEDPLYRRIRQHADQRLNFKLDSTNEARLSSLKAYHRLEREMLQRYHLKGDSGHRVTRARSIMMDVLLEHLFDFAMASYAKSHGEPPTAVTLIALGGYGRRELCPLSDIDIMFLYGKSASGKDIKPLQETLTDSILYPLWDLGMKVGHSSRTVKEALIEATAEDKSLNAMLEARRIYGDLKLYEEFTRTFNKYYRSLDHRAYFKHRLESQLERRKKYGNTVYLQEPDIKNGVGGLRDYQNILWMAKFRMGEASLDVLEKRDYLKANDVKALKRAHNYLLRVRNEIHFNNKRPTDLIDLEAQPKLAWALGYHINDIFKRVEAFMRDYYSAAQTIFTQSKLLEQRLAADMPTGNTPITFRAVLDSRRADRQRFIDGFIITPTTISFESRRVFEDDPIRLIRVFRYMQQYGAQPDFELRFLIKDSAHLITPNLIQSEGANKAFRSIMQTLGHVFPALSLMHELRILGRFMPEFASLTCLVQHEYYHRYTADIHTLATIEQLDRIFERKDETARHYAKALSETDTPALLYLILLLHDIGKGISIKNHAQIGRDMAPKILQRLGIPKKYEAIILFLIDNHLEMARFWQRYDLDDPRTPTSFAQFMGSEDALRYLYVLTYCDACGTAEGLWNSYKNSLHASLYQKTLELLHEDNRVLEQRQKERREMIQNEITERVTGKLPPDQIEAHLNLLPERYFIQHNVDEIVLHMHMIQKLLENINQADSLNSLTPIIEWHNDIDQGMTVVNVVTWDRAGLFYKLAGALTVAGVNILSTKAISRSDHITIDTFYVVEPGGGIVQNKATHKVFNEHLKQSLLYNSDLMPKITELAEDFRKDTFRKTAQLEARIPVQVDVYHELSLRRTIVEVQANDDVGLLYQLARSIFNYGFDITFARIATERGVALDTFYIEAIEDKAKVDTTSLMELRAELLDIVQRNNYLAAS